MKIAIIGSGISGLVAAWMLHDVHEVTIFEANDYIGGHTHTIDVKTESGDYAIDTGFIVFNEATYPNFCKILKKIGVESQPTKMSFSVKSLVDGLEYNGDSLSTFFAQRKNIFNPDIYRILRDSFRFNRQMDEVLAGTGDNRSLAVYLKDKGYSSAFLDYFILPMTSSLWSAPPAKARDFPVALFARFFRNHGILNLRNRLQWRVITGGSTRYVEKLTVPFLQNIRLDSPVHSIRRLREHVAISSANGEEHFDHVILAVHSDQVLAMLADPTDDEREVLGAISYQPNTVQLHTDTAVMPEIHSIWAAWNYAIPLDQERSSTVTYDMNILQSIDSPEEFLVSLNQEHMVKPEKVIGSYTYDHPAYTPAVPAAQQRHGDISGVGRTHYCGAYWGYGFHEDGVRSALAVCRYFDKVL
jgi:predicted NAD/FAD-binding protein